MDIARAHPQSYRAGYTLHRCLDERGQFDYAKYRAIQEAGNKAKLGLTWVREENIQFLSEYLLREQPRPAFGICHGTRRGNEQKWFRQFLGCEVIGTEISPTAGEFPHTVQWDFHEANPAWTDKTDFIYSNSFDHSYDPPACLRTWMKTVRRGGVCILEHSNLHGPEGATELDPFGAEIVEMPFLITMWGQGAFFVREILTAPVKNNASSYLYFIVIERRR